MYVFIKDSIAVNDLKCILTDQTPFYKMSGEILQNFVTHWMFSLSKMDAALKMMIPEAFYTLKILIFD